MFWNYLAICAGIFICFGAYYFKSTACGISGFSWGALIGIIVAIATSESFFDFDERIRYAIWIFGILGGVICFFSIKIENAAAIEGALAIFAAYTVVVGYDNEGSLVSTIFVAIILAVVAAFICYKNGLYALILVSAITGGFLFNLGRVGVSEESSFSEIVFAVMMFGFERELSSIIWGTIVLAGIGVIFQLYRINLANEKSGSISSDSNYRPLRASVSNQNNNFSLDGLSTKDKEIEVLKSTLADMKKQMDEFAKANGGNQQTGVEVGVTATETNPESDGKFVDNAVELPKSEENEILRIYGVEQFKRDNSNVDGIKNTEERNILGEIEDKKEEKDLIDFEENKCEEDKGVFNKTEEEYAFPNFCMNCGRKLEPSFKVCPNCGMKIVPIKG